ncbi:response regulator transcription factor [Rhizobium mayense]|uniref:Response regulator n=1 Tax=Rhizobium mayense TaxID=1312184 RepID=A0ABT7JRK3_9HYPH|nr:response regulator [Rhizobium mayense]MDL2398980.1 response regulator [Rhizobium mayense]
MPGSASIAIIDDDQSVRESIQDLLETEGVRSHLYASAEDFLSQEGYREVDCILADVRMPGISGIEMLVLLKGVEGCPPVLMMTSYTTAQMKVAALRNGASAFLGKPLDSGELIACIRNVIG